MRTFEASGFCVKAEGWCFGFAVGYCIIVAGCKGVV